MSEIIRARASSIGSFFDCPLRWAEVNLYGNSLPSTAPAAIGTAVHASTAAFDEGGTTVLDSAEVAVELIKRPEEDVNWGDASRNRAIEVALGVHTRYCNDIAPTVEYKAVELTLDPLQIEINEDITLELTGTLDRIRVKDGKQGVADVKTGARAMSMNSGRHKAQVGVYSLLAENQGFHITLPETLIKLQTSSNYGAGLEDISGAREALLGTDDSIGLLECMGKMLKEGLFYGNPQSWLCSDKYCPKFNNCNFR